MHSTAINEKTIFQIASEIRSPEVRKHYLNQICADDHKLHERVQYLLRMNESEPGFLEAAPVSYEARSDGASPEVGSQVGPYRLRECIGRGGMGVVYVADQSEPLHRKVAFKVIKPGMASCDVVARFEAERQALAMMDHPNIARVFDGGVTAAGQPYFVMELVQGPPITEYCDLHKASPRIRLGLFITICRAVHHAHQRGVIHRDLKPSNVLVPRIDGVPVPKVIDFGVAKAIGHKITEQTVYTQFAQLVGTPLYMSPEQAELGIVDIDTRSDVYSLGVLLYELLTGSTPFDSETLRLAGFDEMRRIIREDEPPRPSDRISTLATGALPTIAECRSIDVRQLGKSLKGELDWIVMKAMSKERDRRYDSPEALAQDIERYLSGGSVQACPPSLGYRVHKFASRNKALIVGSLIVGISLIGGTLASSWQAYRALRAEGQAIAQANEARRKSEQTAAVLKFVEDKLLAVPRPHGEKGGLGYDATMRQAVEAALPYVESEFEGDPLMKASLLETMGVSLLSLGDAPLADKLLRESFSIRKSRLEPDNPETLDVMTDLMKTKIALEQFDEALWFAKEVYVRKKAKHGPNHWMLAGSMANLGHLYTRLGQSHIARQHEEKALELLRSAPEKDQLAIAGVKNNMALSYRNMGDIHGAIRLQKEALDCYSAMQAQDQLDAWGIKHELAHSLERCHQNKKARELLEEVSKALTRKLGSTNPHTLRASYCLANRYRFDGQYDRALLVYEDIVADLDSRYGPNHEMVIVSKFRKAICLFENGDFREARRLHEVVYSTRKAKYGENHPEALKSRCEIALCDLKLGHADKAVEEVEGVVAIHRDRCESDDKDLSARADLLASLVFMTQISRQAEQLDESLQYAEEFIDLLNESPKRIQSWAEGQSLVRDLTLVLRTFAHYGDWPRYEEVARKCTESAPHLGYTWNLLGIAQVRTGECSDAIGTIKKSMAMFGGFDAFDGFYLALALARSGDQDQAAAWYQRAVKRVANHRNYREVLATLKTEAETALGTDSGPRAPDPPLHGTVLKVSVDTSDSGQLDSSN